jgi:small-conductance mechanosensitive channel
MLNLSKVVRQLRSEREQTQAKLDQLNTALKVLAEVGTAGSRAVSRQATSGKRRPMSAAAKKKIAAAQRARWAKWRAAQKHK